MIIKKRMRNKSNLICYLPSLQKFNNQINNSENKTKFKSFIGKNTNILLKTNDNKKIDKSKKIKSFSGVSIKNKHIRIIKTIPKNNSCLISNLNKSDKSSKPKKKKTIPKIIIEKSNINKVDVRKKLFEEIKERLNKFQDKDKDFEYPKNTEYNKFKEKRFIKKYKYNNSNKTIINTSSHNVSVKKIKVLPRIKTFKVVVKEGWESKNGLNVSVIRKKSIEEEKDYQKSLIVNELEIINDNANYFKLHYLGKLQRHVEKDDINNNSLQQINILLEETSSLFLKIVKLIIYGIITAINIPLKYP
jgi:hypothetical protein